MIVANQREKTVVTQTKGGGGHLLDCQGAGLRVQIQDLADVRIAMPESAAFLQADVSQDPTGDLDIAERGKRRPGQAEHPNDTVSPTES